jgi:glycosyltransferase involved in cell wall biosynthesis
MRKAYNNNMAQKKQSKGQGKLDVSIIIPAYNEEENITILYEQVKKVLDDIKVSYEIIFVNDGSKDRTLENLKAIKDPHLKVISFRRNFGQTAAMDAGFKAAKGRILIPLDADLQNDPTDIPRLITKLGEGYDVVSGWRKYRKDPLSKRIISRGANVLRKILIQDNIHDSGCTLKAYRKECFDNLTLYGEMHRFIPALLQWQGFHVTEIPTKHHARRYGKTKYSMGRVIRGFLDMIIVGFWMKYSARPIHLFGTLGIITTFIGGLVGLYLTLLKVFFNVAIGNRPLLLLTVLLLILGVQFVIFGVMSDILIKIYYKNQPNYSITEIIDGKDKKKIKKKEAKTE